MIAAFFSALNLTSSSPPAYGRRFLERLAPHRHFMQSDDPTTCRSPALLDQRLAAVRADARRPLAYRHSDRLLPE